MGELIDLPAASSSWEAASPLDDERAAPARVVTKPFRRGAA